jgi:hemerythrin-like domain-containing protein
VCVQIQETVMHDPVGKWHEEHVYFQRLLALLAGEVDKFALGDTPNYPLMLDVIFYLREYSDAVHHPREDAVFARLMELCPDRQLPLARLRQEHRILAHHGETLRELLEQAAADAVVRRGEVEVAAATYLVYYGNHIANEEEAVLPLAQKTLTPADWEAARNAVPPADDPVFGTRPEARFHDLRRRIAAEA